MAVLEVFFKEPTLIHFIREISKRVKLAPTSVRNHLKDLEKEDLIKKKHSKPFDGFVADRENEKFIYYKQAYNFYSLYKLRNEIKRSLHPQTAIVFGSYARGEDREDSDIDILIISKIKKDLKLKKHENELGRKIHAIMINSIDELDKGVKKNILNGWVIEGEI